MSRAIVVLMGHAAFWNRPTRSSFTVGASCAACPPTSTAAWARTASVVDIIAPDRTYQGQTFSDEMHFVCPWHGYEYDLKTGQCMGDSKLKLKRFDVVRRGDDIYVVA